MQQAVSLCPSLLGGGAEEREWEPHDVQLNVRRVLRAGGWFLHLNPTGNARNISLLENQTDKQAADPGVLGAIRRTLPCPQLSLVTLQ